MATSSSPIPCTAVASAGIGHDGQNESRESGCLDAARRSSRTTANDTISSRPGVVPVVSQSNTAYANGAGTSARLCDVPWGATNTG